MPECGLRVFERAMELHIGADCPSKNLEFDEAPRDLEFVCNRVNATLHEIRRFEWYLLSPTRPFALRCKEESVGSGVFANDAPILDERPYQIRDWNECSAIGRLDRVCLHLPFECCVFDGQIFSGSSPK
jgi:hypothetical protein